MTIRRRDKRLSRARWKISAPMMEQLVKGKPAKPKPEPPKVGSSRDDATAKPPESAPAAKRPQSWVQYLRDQGVTK